MHTRGWKVTMHAIASADSPDVTREEKLKQEIKANKAIRKLFQHKKGVKVPIDPKTGWSTALDLKEEGAKAWAEKQKAKEKYDAAVAAGKIKPKKKRKNKK